jgi:hypothetical protein
MCRSCFWTSSSEYPQRFFLFFKLISPIRNEYTKSNSGAASNWNIKQNATPEAEVVEEDEEANQNKEESAAPKPKRGKAHLK